MPLISENKALHKRELFWHFPIYLQAVSKTKDESRDPLFRTRPGSVVRSGKWKLHEYFEDHALELYNLETDLYEQTNLIYDEPEKAKELLSLLKNWRKKVNAPVPNEPNEKFISIN